MAKSLSADERAVLEDQLVPTFAALLGDDPFPTEPAELELFAATMLVPLELPEMPAAVSAGFFGEIEKRGDQDAAGMLAALAVLATGDAALNALAGVERLALKGVRSPVTGQVGAATVREAARLEGGDVDLLVAVLGRPRTQELQVGLLGVEREETGGALFQCMLSPPMPEADARALLEQAAGGGRAEPIEIETLVADAVSAADRAVELGIALDHEAAIVLPIISRALTGDPGGLARPETIPPWEEDDDDLVVDRAEDEDGYREITGRLLEELADWAKATYPKDGPVGRNGNFVGSTMLDWKSDHGDGRLGRWTRADLAEFLLDWFPRKVTPDGETLGDVIDCVIAFLTFLDERESLSGEPLAQLVVGCEEIREEFLEVAVDPSAWGVAKSLMMQMLDDGVDPDDPAAFEQWMTSFNERPRAERDAIIGGPADRMLAAGQPANAPSPAKRSKQAAQRKSQRAARKRNRRR
ncbi:MAG TPA: hypothetical protein VG165_00025 [Solirubrobacteraceae bacterium]|jgi:hypothetical protein|nr:hypothetical protein [Solirubrobacteraceae bacterium]